MLFNSLEFAVFLPIVFIFYWFVFNNNLKLQNLFILFSSYFFYAWWDWRFLFLIIFSSIIDFYIALRIHKENSLIYKKVLLSMSLIVNLGLLCFFKYYNFFLDSFIDSFQLLGYAFTAERLNIVLPVGISFYTFQTLSYTIDVYKKKLKPTNNMVSFLAFVSFFPQLVAGPIERATNLLPQFIKKREFHYDNGIDGMRRILWGLFKKIVIADSCAIYSNHIFNNYTDFSGLVLFLGAVFFAFQIYGDFSGYSDIAIGVAKLLGFSLMINFKFPYFSRDIAEFWRRWHISLSSWFRDYLYIPLGGSRGGKVANIRNIFIIFIVSGLWHGANWTFIAWGTINAIYFLPLMFLSMNRENLDTVAEGTWLPSLKEILQILSTFILVVIAWIFFRSENLHMSFYIYSKIFSIDFLNLDLNEILSFSGGWVFVVDCFIILFFIIFEWIQRNSDRGLTYIFNNFSIGPIGRTIFYFILIFIILFSIDFHSPEEFIYFQF